MSMLQNDKQQPSVSRLSVRRGREASGHRIPQRLAGSAHSVAVELFGGLPVMRGSRFDVRSPERF